MIDHIEVISWYMQLIKELLSNGIQTRLFFIHIVHHIWWDEYNFHIYIEYKHTTGFILLQKYPVGNINNSDLLSFIPGELDLTSTPFSNTTILKYEIELPPSGNKVGFNLLDDEHFKIPDVTDTIPNTPANHQLLT